MQIIKTIWSTYTFLVPEDLKEVQQATGNTQRVYQFVCISSCTNHVLSIFFWHIIRYIKLYITYLYLLSSLIIYQRSSIAIPFHDTGGAVKITGRFFQKKFIR